jgi:RecB family endonuclease NucS
MVEADSSLLIHSDTGTKALNWMPAGIRMTTLVQDSESDGGPENRLRDVA